MSETFEKSSLLDVVDDPAVLDPLSEVTRKERRSLLIASLVATAVSQGGLIPTEISAFGISVSQAERVSLLALMAVVLLYFEIAYIIYSTADLKTRELALLRGRHGLSPALQERLQEISQKLAKKQKEVLENKELMAEFGRLNEQAQLATSVQKIGRLRVGFDAHLPVVLGFVALSFVVLSLRGYTGAAWAIGLVSGIGIVVIAFYFYRSRHFLGRWFARRRRDWHKARYTKIIERMKKEKREGKDLEKLRKRMMDHMVKSMKGPW